MQCLLQGLAFGMVPELQVEQPLASGQLVEVVADTPVDVPLYWHYWRAESPLLADLRQAVRHVAAEVLQPRWQ